MQGWLMQNVAVGRVHRHKTHTVVRATCWHIYTITHCLMISAGPNEDVPAGDIGCSPREVGFMYGQWKRLTSNSGGVLTGKG